MRDVIGDVLRRRRLGQERTLREVAEAARISMPYLSELERGRKEGSSEVLAAVARALGLGLADLLALAQRELARTAPARRRPAPVAPPAQAPIAPDTPRRDAPTERPVAVGQDAAAEQAVVETVAVTSVTALSTRYGGALAAGRQGEVRLAA